MPSSKILFLATIVIVLFFLCGIAQGAVLPAGAQTKMDLLLHPSLTDPASAYNYAKNLGDMLVFNYPEIFSGAIGFIIKMCLFIPMAILFFTMLASWIRGTSSS